MLCVYIMCVDIYIYIFNNNFETLNNIQKQFLENFKTMKVLRKIIPYLNNTPNI